MASSSRSSAILETRVAAWPDEAACARSAEQLAGRAALRDAFIELLGPLGAGKTTFARHLLHGVGVAGTVKSPTYTLIEAYRADALHGAFAIAHCDFYRFDDPGEWEDAGLRDVFAAPGLKLVEWPDKAEGLLPPCDLRVAIVPSSAGELRNVRLDAMSATGCALLP